MTESPTLIQLADSLRTGRLDLIGYLQELRTQFNEREPLIDAFLPEQQRFERLEHEARALLEHFPAPAARPPLFGVPVGVKDIFHVAGFVTRAGSRLPPEVLQGPEAECVTRLKEAGALVLGKTVTAEFAYFAPGPTRNPHNPAHTPGGSSSGSAAAVAAGHTPLALGTQTVASIGRPAAFCGVVGFKPSYNRTSLVGVIPFSPSADTVGFFTHDAPSAALVASILIQNWRHVEKTVQPRLAIPTGPYLEQASEEGRAHLYGIAGQLQHKGWNVSEVAVMPDMAEIVQRHRALIAVEAAQVHADWFARFEPLYHPKTAEVIRRGQTISAAEFKAARTGQGELRAQLMETMCAQRIDAWLAPGAVGAAPRGLDSTGDPAMSLPWTHSGLPTITLPAGQNAAGLPFGIQLIGRWQQDEELLTCAEQVENDLDVLRIFGRI